MVWTSTGKVRHRQQRYPRARAWTFFCTKGFARNLALGNATQRTGAMTRVDWKSFFCNVIPMYYSWSIIFRIRDMWLNLPLHSVRPCGPRSRQIWSSFIVGKSVFATFSVCFQKLSDLFESPSKLALEMSILWNLSWFSSFSNEDFSAKVCQAFPIWLQTRACQASFGQFSRQAGPLFAGAPGARCYVFSVWYECRIAFTLRVLLLISLGSKPLHLIQKSK